ncbi:MAG: WYL domain-containing protein [Clostridia bacterium]|nr:WYL domain-containing protein [Clostridia bacterium]
MIFSELYSLYYRAAEKILGRAVEGGLTEKEAAAIVAQTAFSESGLTILPALKEGKWQLMYRNGTTPLRHKPTMPLTLLEKRWLKAIFLDPRMKLFDLTDGRLEKVLGGAEPLYRAEDFHYFDRYADGDNYSDEVYIRHFRTILYALKHKVALQIEQPNRFGKKTRLYVMPERLEYSEKDDKFRLISAGYFSGSVLNLGRLTACRLYWPKAGERHPGKLKSVRGTEKTLTMAVTDERNALERVMMHFAHFKKTAEKTADGTYRVTVYYHSPDETELVIRVLSFGPFVKVTEPESFAELIRERLKKQMELGI